MARRIIQHEFEPVEFLDDDGLNVHLHEHGTDAIVVFVHGLNGKGYGTWGNFPKYLFESSEISVDVAVFDYFSGLRRRHLFRSTRLTTTGQELGESLIELPHKSIILVGHSMGGLICKLAIKHICERDGWGRDAQRIASLITLGTPHAGALAARWFPWTTDTRFLKAHSRELQVINRFFQTNVNQLHTDVPDPNRRWHIPSFLVAASSDKAVDEFSASLGVPDSQWRPIRGSHTSIVKPKSPSSLSVDWVTKRISEVLNSRVSSDSLHSHSLRRYALPEMRNRYAADSRRPLVTQFEGYPQHVSWERAFHEACRAVETEQEVQFVDQRDADQSLDPSLLVRVIETSHITAEETKDILTRDGSLQQNSPAISIGVSPYGLSSDDLVEIIYQLLGPTPRGASRWVQGTSSLPELKSTFAEWLRTVAIRRSPDNRRNDLLEESILEAESHGPPSTAIRPRYGDY